MLELLMTFNTPVVRLPDQFIGEVPVTQLMDGESLAATVRLTKGISINSTSAWLEFRIDNETIYVAKKPYRMNISWNDLNTLGLLDGGRWVVIQGKTYILRVLKGFSTNPATVDAGYDLATMYGSEWNRILYPLIPNPINQPTNPSGDGTVFGSWADYTDDDLAFNARCWTQETMDTYRSFRGGYSISYGGGYLPNDTGGQWRPCLTPVK